MYASIRHYDGNAQLAEAVARHEREVADILRGIRGFRAYYLVSTPKGAVSVTVCDDREGAEESNRLAAEWVRTTIPEVATSPQVSAGEVVMSA